MNNSPTNDTLVITIEQNDGDAVLSHLQLTYPNLPNDIANLMHFGIIDAIRAKVGEWASAKAEGLDPKSILTR